jgi:hypothetical protein
MRAPLRAMQGFSQVLAEECGPLSPLADDCVRRISTAAARMDRLIQDGFNYGRLMREDLPLTPTDPEALLRGMIETYPTFQPPNASVRIEGQFPLVQANEAGLTQCVSNLLGNAVKFVAPGVIPEVRVWAESGGGRVRLLFQDNGIGMSKDAHRVLFRIFQRLGTDYEGTGVGLAIVKKAPSGWADAWASNPSSAAAARSGSSLAERATPTAALDVGRSFTRSSQAALNTLKETHAHECRQRPRVSLHSGPTNIPDAVLAAMHRPAIDIYSGDMLEVTRSLLEDLPRCFAQPGARTSTRPTATGAGRRRSPTCFPRGDTILALESGLFALGWADMAKMMGVKVES